MHPSQNSMFWGPSIHIFRKLRIMTDRTIYEILFLHDYEQKFFDHVFI